MKNLTKFFAVVFIVCAFNGCISPDPDIVIIKSNPVAGETIVLPATKPGQPTPHIVMDYTIPKLVKVGERIPFDGFAVNNITFIAIKDRVTYTKKYVAVKAGDELSVTCYVLSSKITQIDPVLGLKMTKLQK